MQSNAVKTEGSMGMGESSSRRPVLSVAGVKSTELGGSETSSNELVGSEGIRAYVLGGNATFTVASRKSRVRYTFNVRRAGSKNGRTEPIWFVSHVAAVGDSRYMGVVRGDRGSDGYGLTRGSRVAYDYPAHQAFEWFWDGVLAGSVERLSQLEVLHSGKCGRCQRPLTTPASIKAGLGPECIKEVGR